MWPGKHPSPSKVSLGIDGNSLFHQINAVPFKSAMLARNTQRLAWERVCVDPLKIRLHTRRTHVNRLINMTVEKFDA